MDDSSKNLVLWAVIALILFSLFSNFGPSPSHAYRNMTYSQFVKDVSNSQVRDVSVKGRELSGTLTNGQSFKTFMPMEDQLLLNEMIKKGVEVRSHPEEHQSLFTQIFISWFPMILLIGVWLFVMRQMQGGAGGRGGPMAFGRSRAQMVDGGQTGVTFAHMAGAEEAKEEISELVDFLRDPKKFEKMGAKIPCGALLVGPPGTGKTLLAKAVAGEAQVPFFSIAGSDFVEMFVGVGASRVRHMFEQAKKQSPSIIFIDEIDAVGRKRGAGLGGGHDEREQTLNQLLVEMDGFAGNEGVIVLAATNRPDVLDPALLRPGRFDRQVTVPLPDISGRQAILAVHMKKVTAAKSVDIETIAKGTPGFSGADLANLVNESALLAARANKRKVGMPELEEAKDKIMMGTERRSMAMSDDEKRCTAYHEAGHAIVGLCVPDHDPPYKVTIIPRGRALGVTMFLPEKDAYSQSYQQLMSRICSLYGGRIAEELIFGREHVTTGASNDIEKATEIAKNIVTRWGLNDTMGPIHYGSNDEEVFLGNSFTRSKELSDTTAHEIDTEVRKIIDECYQRAYAILKEKEATLHLMADALMKYETIDPAQIKQIMGGEAPDDPSAKPKRRTPTKPSDPTPQTFETRDIEPSTET